MTFATNPFIKKERKLFLLKEECHFSLEMIKDNNYIALV
jgi:hypothetical protein